MSSNTSTGTTWVPDGSVTAPGLDTDSTVQTKFDVERRLLCTRIAELERELVRERQRREQVITRYEQLLEAERRSENESAGLLERLF